MKFTIAEYAERINPFASLDVHTKAIDAKDITEAKEIAEKTRRPDSIAVSVLFNNQTFSTWETDKGWIYDLGTPKENIFDEFGL